MGRVRYGLGKGQGGVKELECHFVLLIFHMFFDCFCFAGLSGVECGVECWSVAACWAHVEKRLIL